MRKREKLKWAFLSALLLVLAFGVNYAWRAFPIISGYGAKNMASAIFLQHRQPKEILKEDLGRFPLSLGRFTVNEKDLSVTGTVLGVARSKAIYRPGLGCTLINDLPETAIRKQVFRLPPVPPVNRDSIAWPAGNKITGVIPATINRVKLQAAIRHALQARVEGKPAYTRAVVILHDGQLVAEEYAPGFDNNTVMLGWSVSKSLTGTLIGILVNEKKLSPAAPAPVPEWKGTNKENITLEHLLQQTSGLQFEEAYDKPSEVTNMLFKSGDMAAFTAKVPLQHQPGSVFSYSSGNSNLLSRIIRHTVGEKDYASFPYTALFHRIGMYSAVLEPDASGTYIGSSYSYATARDFARFGLLYYQNGRWNSEQVLPEDWVKKSVQPSMADKQKLYGYQFWLNGFGEDGHSRIFPDVPADMFYASGYGGQHIFIIPSKKLVVVRTGLQKIDGNLFLKEVLAAVEE